MKMNRPWVAALVALSLLAVAQPLQAGIVHRYSFNEGATATTADDSVGTADGVLKGQGGYFDGAGHLSLPGGTSSAATPDTISGYLDLPNHIINVLTNLTIESWVNWQGSGAWQRIFDLGTSAGGEDISDGSGNYLFLSPQGDVNLRFAIRDPATGTEPVQCTATAPLETQGADYICVTVTYDYAANVSRLFSNGVLVASSSASVALSTINDVNNWLGRSQWGDSMFQGSYDEFRIYDNAFNPVEAAASYLAGVSQPSTDPASLGALQAVTLTVAKTTMTEQDTQTASGKADYANLVGVTLGGVPGATITSDNTAVLTADAAGVVTAVKAGTANLTLSYGGQTDVEAITVNARQTGAVVAGSLYVDLRAADTSAGASTWPNKALTGDFTAVGTPTYVANVDGTGVAGVRFNPATPFTDAYAGPITTTDLHGSSDRSIEVWAYNPALRDDETLVSLGHRGGAPDGSNNAFGYGSNLGYGAAGHWGSPDMGWGSSGAPAPGQWHYLVYTYDGVSTASVYADGLLKYSESVGVLSTHADMAIRIAAQTDTAGADFDLGQALSGYIAMVRVHTGLLSAADVANNFIYGVEVTAPGNLQGASLTLSDPTLYGPGAKGKATVKANYATRNYLLVTGSSTFVSSDDSVVMVDAAGVYTAVNVGSATIATTYKGVRAAQTVQVVSPLPTELKHRYSFNDAVGSTTVKDSAGTADGQIKGTGAVFDGAGLTLPGGTSSAATPDIIAGYVDLPNGIISSLHNATFEAWVTYGTASSWQRIFDFGTSQGGEDASTGYGRYLFLSPQGSANLRFAVRDDIIDGEPIQLTSTAPLPTGQGVYVAVTYDQNANVSKLYSNAVVVANGSAVVPLSSIPDVNNWLGRSQWGDPMFAGKYNEFRIWEGAFSLEEVAAAYGAGPDKLPELAPSPTITASLSGGMLVLRWPATATGFGIESTLVLGPQASWGTVDISGAVDDGGQKKLTLKTLSATCFYRLRK